MSPVSKRVVAAKGSGGVANPSSAKRTSPADKGPGATTKPSGAQASRAGASGAASDAEASRARSSRAKASRANASRAKASRAAARNPGAPPSGASASPKRRTGVAQAAKRSAESTAPAKAAAVPKPGPADAGNKTRAAEAGLELYFLRHADAGDPAEWSGDDADRPLSKKGRRQSKRLGRLLDDLRFQPDILLTSPKLRSVDTARIVGRAIGVKAGTDERLAGGLDATGLSELIAGLDDGARRIMLVGHDPEFSTLVSWLVGAPVSLRKGALARADLPDRSVRAGAGSLGWLLPPDAVPG